MAKTIQKCYTDTSVEGVTALTFPRAVLNFGADYRLKSQTGTSEIILTNITSPTDRPEEIRIGYTPVSNIYQGTSIEPSVAAPTKKGASILAKVTNVITVTDASAPDYRVDLPLSCHLVIKVPNSEFVTSEVVQEALGRLMSSLFDTGSTTTSRLDSILRGSLVPSDL